MLYVMLIPNIWPELKENCSNGKRPFDFQNADIAMQNVQIFIVSNKDNKLGSFYLDEFSTTSTIWVCF